MCEITQRVIVLCMLRIALYDGQTGYGFPTINTFSLKYPEDVNNDNNNNNNSHTHREKKKKRFSRKRVLNPFLHVPSENGMFLRP